MEKKPGEIIVPSSSALWQYPHHDLNTRLRSCIDSSCRSIRSNGREGYVFFRADDVAVPGKGFIRLIDLFTMYKAPLALAVVPAWLTKPRWRYIKTLLEKDPSLWCLHQHGWRHINHEINGKKQEFGKSRERSQIMKDLIRGRQRLELLMGNFFYPVFTPPWNRCDIKTIQALKDLNYYAVSRMRSELTAVDGLPDFSVNVDLHTTRETDPVKDMDNLLNQLGSSLSKGLCGIMIHHQRMNDAAFGFLEVLIESLLKVKGFQIVHFKDLVKIQDQ